MVGEIEFYEVENSPCKETDLEWRIDDIFSYFREKGGYQFFCQSPSFSYANYVWDFRLWPNSEDDHVKVTFWCANNPKHKIDYIIGLRKYDGSVEQMICGTMSYYETYSQRSFLIERTKLLCQNYVYAPDNILTITCTLKMKDDCNTTQSTSTEQNKTKSLVLKTEISNPSQPISTLAGKATSFKLLTPSENSVQFSSPAVTDALMKFSELLEGLRYFAQKWNTGASVVNTINATSQKALVSPTTTYASSNSTNTSLDSTLAISFTNSSSKNVSTVTFQSPTTTSLALSNPSTNTTTLSTPMSTKCEVSDRTTTGFTISNPTTSTSFVVSNLTTSVSKFSNPTVTVSTFPPFIATANISANRAYKLINPTTTAFTFSNPPITTFAFSNPATTAFKFSSNTTTTFTFPCSVVTFTTAAASVAFPTLTTTAYSTAFASSKLTTTTTFALSNTSSTASVFSNITSSTPAKFHFATVGTSDTFGGAGLLGLPSIKNQTKPLEWNFGFQKKKLSADASTQTEEELHVNKLLQALKEMLLSSKHSDFILNVKGKEMKVHKLILAAHSPVFAAMMEHDTKEKATGIVDIDDFEPLTITPFLDFLYTGKVENLNSDNVLHLYEVADKYQVTQLSDLCLRYMIKNISIDNFCDILTLSLRHHIRDLTEVATQFFLLHSKEIAVTAKWMTFLAENPVAGNELFLKFLNLKK